MCATVDLKCSVSDGSQVALAKEKQWRYQQEGTEIGQRLSRILLHRQFLCRNRFFGNSLCLLLQWLSGSHSYAALYGSDQLDQRQLLAGSDGQSPGETFFYRVLICQIL